MKTNNKNAWFSIQEIVELKLTDLPKSASGLKRKAKRERWQSRVRKGRGSGNEYHISCLSESAQAALIKNQASIYKGIKQENESAEKNNNNKFNYNVDEIWNYAHSCSQKLRDEGCRRANLIRQAMRLKNDDTKLIKSFSIIAEANDISTKNLVNWYYGTNRSRGARHYREQDWDAALIPRYVGRTSNKEIADVVWSWYCDYYLSRRQPSYTEAYRRTCEIASKKKLENIASSATFIRRIKKEYSAATIILRRQGEKALMQAYPPQRRDKSVFTAGEAVVGDGLKFDKLYVKFPDGEIINTSTGWFWADLRTNFIVAFRLGKTENTDLFRLATYDLVGQFKPDFAYLDNTRVASNKAMTGGAKNRNRGRNKPTDPIGLLNQIGICPQFTNPDKIMGSPGAKPIERSFGIGGIHDKVANHPDFLNRGYNKKTAIHYTEFKKVVTNEVKRFNEQKKRLTSICRGSLSFNEAFQESAKQTVLTKLTESQRALLLLLPEVTRANRRSGEIALKTGRLNKTAHRYWSEELMQYRNQQVIVYFDPENLTKKITVQTLAGKFICTAEHMGDVAFNDKAAASEHNKNKQRFRKATKKAAAAQQKMNELEIAALYPAGADDNKERKFGNGVIRGNFKQKNKLIDDEVKNTDHEDEVDGAIAKLMPQIMTEIRRKARKIDEF